MFAAIGHRQCKAQFGRQDQLHHHHHHHCLHLYLEGEEEEEAAMKSAIVGSFVDIQWQASE